MKKRPGVDLRYRRRNSPSDQRMAANSGPMPLMLSNIAAGAEVPPLLPMASSTSRSAFTASIFG